MRLAGELCRLLSHDLCDQRIGQGRAQDHREVVGRGDGLPPRPVEARRRRSPSAAGANARRFAVHRRDCDALSAEHVGQHVRGVVTGHHQQRLQQLACGVRLARLQSHAGALDLGVGLVGAGEVVGAQIVEHHHRQQRLDRAGGRVGGIRVFRRQDAAGVQIGQQPYRRRTVGNRDGPCRLHAGIGGRHRGARSQHETYRERGEQFSHRHERRA